MATWQGLYETSVNSSVYANLTVNQFEEVETQPTLVRTSFSEDLLILPSVFVNNTRQTNSNTIRLNCGQDIGVRKCRAFTTVSTWYEIPIPFYPNSALWLSFWNEIKINPLAIEFEYLGENLLNRTISIINSTP